MMPRPASLLLLLSLALLAGCKTQLNSGLSEREANEEVALLLRSGIPASREADPKTSQVTVWVEQSRFADAVDLLGAHGLPRQHYDSIANVFRSGGLIASPTEDRARMVYALSEELSHTISEIGGVLAARVQIVLPDNDPLRQDQPPSSASVFIRYRPGSEVVNMIPQVKMLVANGVAGLSYDKVEVTLDRAAVANNLAPQLPAMVNFFGIWVEAGSVRMLQMVAAGAGSLILLLSAAAAWFVWRSQGSAPRAGASLTLR